MRKRVLFVNGGLGKQLCASRAVLQLHQQTGEKLGLISGWVDAWRNHPGIDKACHPSDPVEARHLYAKADVLMPEPYSSSPYRFDKEHLVVSFCKLLGVDPPLSVLPYLPIVEEEKDWAAARVAEYIEQSGEKGQPVAFMPFGTSAHGPGLVRSFSMDSARLVVQILRNRGYVVFQFRGQSDYKIPGTITPDLDVKYSLQLVSAFKHVVSIDTWLQHASAALDIPALVFWGATDSEQLGYSLHKNVIKGECPMGSCNRPALVFPDPFVCPYDKDCMEWTEEALTSYLERYLEQ